MTTLTDARLDAALRELLEMRAEEVAAAAPPADAMAARLEQRVVARVLLSPAFRLASTMALLAVLLVVLLGLLLLIGSQRPVLEGSLLRGCESYLPAETLASVDGNASTTTLYADGWFVTDPMVQSMDQALSRGRMGLEGIVRYLDAIDDAGLVGSCGVLYADVPGEGGMKANVDGGDINVRWENRGWVDAFRALTPDESAEVVALLGRLQHPEEWLPPAAWITPSEPYWPRLYHVGVQFPAPRDPATVLLSDGSSLADFDVVMGPDSISGAATLDRERALAMRSLLPADRGGNPPGEDMWDLLNDDGSSQATIWIWAFPEAADHSQVLVPTSAPPSPTNSPTPAADEIPMDPCGLIALADVEAILSEGYRHGTAETADQPAPGRWKLCRFQGTSAGERYWRSFELLIRREPTNDRTARELVAYMFGPVPAEDVPGGGRLWVNDCLGRCQNAIAVWTDPYFAMVVATQDTEYSESQRRALAGIVLDSLRAIP